MLASWHQAYALPFTLAVLVTESDLLLENQSEAMTRSTATIVDSQRKIFAALDS